jgi:hypothetical protein
MGIFTQGGYVEGVGAVALKPKRYPGRTTVGGMTSLVVDDDVTPRRRARS